LLAEHGIDAFRADVDVDGAKSIGSVPDPHLEDRPRVIEAALRNLPDVYGRSVDRATGDECVFRVSRDFEELAGNALRLRFRWPVDIEIERVFEIVPT
jgi:hypothetical protein